MDSFILFGCAADDTSLLIFNGCVRHVGLCPLPRFKEIGRFPRSAADGDQSAARDADAGVGTEQGAGAKALQWNDALAFHFLRSHPFVHVTF